MKTFQILGTVLLAGILSITTLCAGTPEYPSSEAPEGVAVATEGQYQPVRGINSFVRKKYPGCRILDRDTDDGWLEVKIRHAGREKVLLFVEGHWVRTLWELRRNELPATVLNTFKRKGFRYENIDDNDNSGIDTPRGRFYAVQAERNDREAIYIVSSRGDIVRRYSSDGWDDGRTFDENWSGRWADDGDDRFDEGDDEWDRHCRRHCDDGDDRFDEGDDEWDDRYDDDDDDDDRDERWDDDDDRDDRDDDDDRWDDDDDDDDDLFGGSVGGWNLTTA